VPPRVQCSPIPIELPRAIHSASPADPGATGRPHRAQRHPPRPTPDPAPFRLPFPHSRFIPSAQSRVGRCSGASSCFNTYFAFVNRSERLLDSSLALGRKRLQFHASKPPRLPQSQTVFIPAKLNLLRQVWSDVFLRILSVCGAVWHVVVSCRHGKFSSVTRKL